MTGKDNLKAYWEKKGLEKSSQATMRDFHLRGLEVEALRIELQPDDIVLDAGAGNGASGIQLAPNVKHLILTDFASSMVREAENTIARSGVKNADALVADVLNLSSFMDRRIDTVISTRCLINLTSFEEQCLAISQIHNVLVTGGRLLLLESTVDGWNNLNALRAEFALNPIELHWHNTVFEKAKLVQELKGKFEIVKCVNFGNYFLISRVLYPANIAPKEPSFDNPMNELAVKLWKTQMVNNLEDYSPLLMYVCKKID